MERVTPQKNEAAFRKWDWERRWPIRGFWILTSLYILAVVVYPLVYPHVYPHVHTFIPPALRKVPGVQADWGLPAIVVMGLLYVIVLLVIRWHIRCSLSKCSKDASIFTALVAAEDLEKGDPVRASLYMDRLLPALSDFLRQKLVALGASSVAPQDFMHVTPETIPRRAVRRAIQADEDTKDFQERLGNLAIGLAGNMDTGYLAAHQFLVWLDRRTGDYQQKSFLDRRPTLKTILLKVAPVILPFASAIVVAIL